MKLHVVCTQNPDGGCTGFVILDNYFNKNSLFNEQFELDNVHSLIILSVNKIFKQYKMIDKDIVSKHRNLFK